MGTFGNARGSGLARGKRATPAAAPTASNSNATYKPTSVSVLTPKREYTNPFAPEPAPAAPVAAETPVIQPTENPNGPVASASEPPAVTAPASGEPVAPPAQVIQPSVEKAEIKVLPPSDAKRPTVSWGESHDAQEQRSNRETRPTFNPDRRGEQREPREPRRDPRNFEPRDSGKAQDTRFPRRDTALEQRDRSRDNRDYRAPSGEPVKKSGGFIGWLKGLFGGKPAETTQPAQQGSREQRDGEFHRRRHRGGRGRGGSGFQGENRGPRPEGQQGGQNFQGGEGSGNQGDNRFEGGGGGGHRRRRRGGRGRYRDDRGPRPEGQQGGGAI
jgi:translation initiation factor IF-2